jgi:SAM-dependent methyltransferase
VGVALGISHRRRLLDAELARRLGDFAGVVLEIGAKRVRRGAFRPPSARVTAWVRLDVAEAERPDVVADVQHLPVRDASVDWVVCLEVLQYVASPDAAVREIARVLRPGGAAVVSAPFLHRSDGPTDRHRFTEMGVRELLAAPGLRIERVAAQAAFFGTLANQLRQAVAHAPNRWARWPLAAATRPLELALLAADRLGAVRRSEFLSSFSTGFVVVARKTAERP